MSGEPFQGVYTALLTPFLNDNGINEPVLRALVAEQLVAGVHGLVVAGSTAEFTALSIDERLRLAELVIAEVDGRVPILVGTAAYTTDETLSLSRHAEEVGADGILVLPLSMWKLTGEEVKRLFATISDAIDLPIMVYNNPTKASGTDITVDLLNELTELANVRYVKENTNSLHRIQDILTVCGGRVGVFTGDDRTALAAFAIGASGWVPGVSNVAPRLCVELFEAVRDSDLHRARQASSRILAIRSAIEWNGATIAGLRAAAELVGFRVGPPRTPLLAASGELRGRIAAVLSDVADHEMAGSPKQ